VCSEATVEYNQARYISSLAHDLGWVAAQDGPGRHVLTHHSCQADHGSRTKPDARPHHRTCGNPDVVLDLDGRRPQAEGHRSKIVVSGAQVGPLGEADSISDADRGQIVNPQPLTKPAMVAYLQPPGEGDLQAGLEAPAPTDARTKKPQQGLAPGGAR